MYASPTLLPVFTQHSVSGALPGLPESGLSPDRQSRTLLGALATQPTELRQSKYMNNIIEQDHRNVKRITKPMLGFQSFNTARKTLRGIEAMNIIRKGQVNGINQGDSVSQAKFIEAIFGIAE